MGIPASIDFTKPAVDGKAESTCISLGWAVFKTSDGTCHLVYQDIVENAGIISTPAKISPPLFRFNQYSPASIGRKKFARAYDVDGNFYEMTTPSSIVGTWAQDAWDSFWAKIGLPSAYEVVSTSFYVAELGADHRQPRKLIGKTDIGGLDPDHRHYNISHLRIIAGMVPASPSLHQTWVDTYLGAKETEEKMWATGGVTLAYVMTIAPEAADLVQIKFALGVCSLKDRYDRKIGAKLVVDRLKEYLGSSAPRQPLIQIDSKGKARFIGLGTWAARVPASMIRPTTVAATEPYMEFCAPFFPRGKAMQIMILRHVLSRLDFEVESMTWGMERIHAILEMVEESASYQLRQAGYREPRKVFHQKRASNSKVKKVSELVAPLLAGGEVKVEASLHAGTPAPAAAEAFDIQPISVSAVSGPEYQAPI